MFIMDDRNKNKSCHSEVQSAEESIIKDRFFGAKNDIAPQNDGVLFAFTLTEVIVVIVIIAALAIILIPNMLSLMPDDHNIKYKKAFYTIQEIVNDIESECQGLKWDTSLTPNAWSDSGVDADDVLSYCYGYGTDGNPKALYLADEICKRLSTVSDCSDINDGNKEKDIKTTDGMMWYFPSQSLASNEDWSNARIYVNVDGKESIKDHIAAASGDESKKVNGRKGIYRMILTSKGKLYSGTKETGEAEDHYLLDNPTRDNEKSHF